MKTILDFENWNRKEHFLFFNQMEEPFFGITTTIDCTIAYKKSKELGVSFFTYYLLMLRKNKSKKHNFVL